MFKTARPLTYSLVLAAALIVCSAQAGFAQLNQNCMVSVLNRTVRANADGSWVLPNIPSGFGLVKARATCVETGVTKFGESDLFNVAPNGVANLPKITLGTVSPIPTSLALAPSTLVFNTAGQTIQLIVTATYPNGSIKDVTAGALGTNYMTSNASIATVSPNGLVTANTNGVVLIQAINDGTPGFTRASIVLSGADSDGDGIPDVDEVGLGLDPQNPIDAEEDYDRDNLTNLQEYRLGTNIRKADSDDDGLSDGQEFLTYHTDPLVSDSDGDLIPDGVEVTTNTNPLDRNNYDLKKATATSIVQPSPFVLTTNTLFPEASQLLSWKATLIDGKTTLDLIADTRTTFFSSNLSLCNFGSERGRIYAGQAGDCVIIVTNNTLEQIVIGTVRSFSPVRLSFLDIPGFANNVDVSGDYAYVAAGSAGLQIVDVKNRLLPRIAASLALAGNSNDVVVVGNFAYVAAGSAGLHVVNVTNPLSPSLAASLNTGGVTWDVVVKGNRAYVANGANGLVIVDVSSPASPVRLGSINLTGTAKGVDVDSARQIAAVAMGTNGLAVVNVANPANPALVSTLDASNDDVRDVAVSGNVAFLADFNRSFTPVDLTNPAAPVLLASTPRETGGLLMDVAVMGTIASGADVFFVNGVPLIDVSNPANVQPRAILSFYFGIGHEPFPGTGIALDAAYVYLTASSAAVENGSTGTTRLYIGQYRGDDVTPPTVSITTPAGPITVTEGANFDVTVAATDNLAVASANVLLDAQVVDTKTVPPYQFSVTAPVAQTSTTLTARATDFGGNTASSSGLTINIAKDSIKPLVQITSPAAGSVREGTVVTEVVTASDNVRVTRVEFLVNDTIFATKTQPPYEAFFTVPVGVTSLRLSARAVDPAGNNGVAPEVLLTVLSNSVPNVLSWVKRIGGTGEDWANASAADSAGNSYVTGTFKGTVSFGPGVSLTATGDPDMFVAKYDTGGNLLWARQAGGTYPGFAGLATQAYGIAVDAAGNSYITGHFQVTVTFAPGWTLNGEDVFVVKYDAGGNVVWAKQAVGTIANNQGAGSVGRGIAVDTAGNSYVTGEFSAMVTFAPGWSFTAEGDRDIFVAKYDVNGNLVWAKQAGGTADSESTRAIAVDGSGNSYLTGWFFPTITFPGLPALTSAGDLDVFVAKYDANGNPVWAKRAGDIDENYPAAIAVDNLGNSYVTGALGVVGSDHVFVVKYDPFGNPVWTRGESTPNCGGLCAEGVSVAIDAAGNGYVTGVFAGTAIFGPGVSFNSPNNFFIAKYDINANLLWVKAAAMPDGVGLSGGIAIDGAANAYVTGSFLGTATFPPLSPLISAGDLDIFIVKYGVQ